MSIRYLGKHHCGGVIISTKHVLTSSKCLFPEADISEFSIFAGSTNRVWGEKQQLRYITNVTKHPNNDTTNPPKNDIAVIFINEPFKFNDYVRSIELPKQGAIPPAGALATLSGWGKTFYANNTFPEKLRSLEVVVVDQESCKQHYKGLFRTGMMCAGTPGTGKDGCNGDYGGPLALDGTLIGILSWGVVCGSNMFPGVYVHVSHYTNWIENLLTV